jgi:TRAP-type C4-dicarboxylate transport system substrate-binding protein
MKTKIGLIAVSIIMILSFMTAFVGCGNGGTTPTTTATSTSQSVITLKYATNFLKDAPLTQSDIWFMDQWQARSGGRLKIEYYTDGVLGGPSDILGLVSSGSVDLAPFSPAYNPGALALHDGPNMLIGAYGADENQIIDVVNELFFGNATTAALYRQEEAVHNMYMLFPHGAEPYEILSKNPINTLDDLKGLKLRSFGTYTPNILQAVGAVPVSVNANDWYDALLRGTIDGIPMDINFQYTYKLYEVAKWESFNIGSNAAGPLYINLNTWNKLPEDIRALVPQLREDAIAHEKTYYAQVYAQTKQTLEAAGVTWIDVPAAQQAVIYQACQANWPIWLKSLTSVGLGPQGQTIYDAFNNAIAQFQNE